jgi:hypothetical protein
MCACKLVLCGCACVCACVRAHQELRRAADAELVDGVLDLDNPWWEGVEVPADVAASFLAETAAMSPSRPADPNASLGGGAASGSDGENTGDHEGDGDGVSESKGDDVY